MKPKFKDLSKSLIVRNIFAVASGAAAAQAISMVFSPIITRIYGPEDFGVMGVYIATVGVFIPIAAMTYPLAIVLPKNDADAKALMRLSIYIAVFMACFIAIALGLFKSSLLDLLQIQVLEPFVFLIPVGIFFSALSEIMRQWAIRTRQFKITAKTAIIQALILNMAKTGFGWVNPIAAVLVFLSAFANALQYTLLSIGLKNSNYKEERVSSSPISLRKIAKKYIDFPIYRAPQVFINAASQSMPVLLLSSFFGSSSAGFYSIGITVLNVPSTLIGKSVADVFYPRIAEAANNGENLTRLLNKATIALAVAGIIPFATIVVTGPWLFSLVFGLEWGIAGEYARWQALWLFFAFLNRPSVAAISVLGLQRFFLIYEIISIASRIAALALGFYLFNSAIYAVEFFSAIGVLLNGFLILFTLKASKTFSKPKYTNVDNK